MMLRALFATQLALATLTFSAPLFNSAACLPADVPQRSEENLIVAAYNIQFLGQRDHDLLLLAQVIERFDVCGILEVKDEGKVAELASVLSKETGHDWGYVFGIRTWRPGGRYHEAYAALWRRDRVQLGNGVVSGFWDPEEAFRNDPYVVSFRAHRGENVFDFSLALVHTRWSDDAEGTRAGEVTMLAEQINWMRGFIHEQDILIAGDFNYHGTTTEMEAMAAEADLVQLDNNPRTTFKTDGSGYASSYDHFYALDGSFGEFVPGRCHALDVTSLVYGDSSPANMRKARRELSDHLPIWAEFSVTTPDDD